MLLKLISGFMFVSVELTNSLQRGICEEVSRFWIQHFAKLKCG